MLRCKHLAWKRRQTRSPATFLQIILRLAGAVKNSRPLIFKSKVSESSPQTSLFRSDEIDWFVPHQANKRIIDGVARKLGLSPEQVVLTLDRHGNTSAASIPLALNDAVADRRIKRGDLVMLEAMGGGFTWGATLIRW